MDNDRDVGHEMVHDLGINPGASVKSDQRLEKLREFHAETEEKDVGEKAEDP